VPFCFCFYLKSSLPRYSPLSALVDVTVFLAARVALACTLLLPVSLWLVVCCCHCRCAEIKSTPTLRAPLSGTFLQTLPDLVTPLKGYSLFSYATEGVLFISVQLSGDAVSALRKAGSGTNQTPSTGLRHPSFNHCRI